MDVGGQHEWGELVQLDPRTVGVIVRLERETFQVCLMLYSYPKNPTSQEVEQHSDQAHKLWGVAGLLRLPEACLIMLASGQSFLLSASIFTPS